MEDAVKQQLAAIKIATAAALREDLAAAQHVGKILDLRWLESKDSSQRRALSIAGKQVHWIIVECEQALARLEKKEIPDG